MVNVRGVCTRVSLLIAVLLTTAAPSTAGQIAVPAGGDLQAALDAAVSGDTIVLEAGATYTGNFVLRARPMTAPLVIRTAPPAGVTFPARGSWPVPADAVAYAKIVSPNTMPAFQVRPGMHFVTFEHVEFRAVHGQYAVMELGSVGSAQTTYDLAPREIVLDHVFMNVPDTIGVRRGVALNSAKTRIVDCYIAGFKYVGEDAQAIVGWNGPGPFDIEHNYLVGAGENFMLGGSDPSIPGMVATGVRFVRNYLTKPRTWQGSSWTVKNIFELKNAQDVLVEGNIFEHNWTAAQNGFAILFTPRNQYGGNPETVVQRVVFRHNIVRHVSAVFNILGQDYNYPSQVTNDILIENNLFEDVDWSQFKGTGRLLQIEGAHDVVVRNNTSPHNDGQLVFAYGRASHGFVLENNVINYGNYGIHGDGTAPGNSTIATWLPGALILGNVIPAAPSSSYPAGNYYPKAWADVQLQSDYSLAATSPFATGGTDGNAPGVDLPSLFAALTGSSSAPAPPTPVAPQISIASPASGATITGSTVALAVTTSDADGEVVRVAYHANGALVSTVTSAPWSATWSGVAPGTYTLTAVATDSSDLSTTSAPVSITVQAAPLPPTVSITAPVSGSTVTGTSLGLAVAAADPDGSVVHVAYYANGALVADAASAPWSATWSGVVPGSYTLTAVATDATALSTTSAPVGVTVEADVVQPSNQAPSIRIVSPSGGQTFTGTLISLSASASDPDGTVVRVVYYANNKLVAASTSSGSWSASWTNVKQGSYTLTAVATDDDGVTTTSAPVTIAVKKGNGKDSNPGQNGKKGK